MKTKNSQLQPCEIIGQDPAFLNMKAKAKKFARIPTRIPTHKPNDVLLAGETGTGKEIIAKYIHEQSGCQGPFVPVNLTALNESLIESELFGHEKGAFTGAVDTRIGFFEQANDGVLLLDEIDEAPPRVQNELLRVIEDRTIRRVGATIETAINFKLIVAMGQYPRDLIKCGELVPDLYHRFGARIVKVPTLRERPADIPHFASKFFGSKLTNPVIWHSLKSYDWPGNVRELFEFIDTLDPGHSRALTGEYIAEMLEEYIDEIGYSLEHLPKNITPVYNDAKPNLSNSTNPPGDEKEVAITAYKNILIKSDSETRKQYFKNSSSQPNDPNLEIAGEALVQACIHFYHETNVPPRLVAFHTFGRTAMGKEKNSARSALDIYLNAHLP